MSTLHQYQTIREKEKYFESHIVTSIEELKKLQQEKNVIFRGVNNAYYSMYSSFQRHYDKNVLQRLTPNSCREIALRKLIYSIRKDLVDLHLPTLSDYNILALMQHYGLPSTLLDFSTNFEVALSFALLRDEGKTKLPDYVSIYTLPANDINLICSLPNQAVNNAAIIDVGIGQLDEYTLNRLVVDTTKITSDDYNTINDYRLIKGGFVNIVLKSLNIDLVAGNDNPNRDIQGGLFLQSPLATSQIETGFYKKYNQKISSYEIPTSLEDDIRKEFKILGRKDLFSDSNESNQIKTFLKKYL